MEVKTWLIYDFDYDSSIEILILDILIIQNYKNNTKQ